MLSWKVLSDNTTQSKDRQSSGIVDAPQLNESLCSIHEASNLNNADVACNADQGQFSSYERSARSKIPAPRNEDFLWF
jgi:hypothetical protein